MLSAEQLAAAATVGLLGGVHCVGMCSGFAAAMTLGLAPGTGAFGMRGLALLGAYNAGRVLSYVLAGAFAGALGMLAADLLPVHAVRTVMALAAALLVMALGLNLAGWWHATRRLERMGAGLWRRLRPRMTRLLPVSSLRAAVLLGLLWGGVPCGLVYTVLAWALASADPVAGAALMAAFGLGTLPSLMALGVAGAWVRRATAQPLVRRIAGLLVLGWGAWMAAAALGLTHR